MKKLNMKNNFLSAFVALSLSIGMVACSGDDGATGPAGPAGNANVKSNTSMVATSDWTTGKTFTKTIMVSGITQGVVDNGAVMVYLKIEGGISTDSSWKGLPYIKPITGISVGGIPVAVDMTIGFGYDVGKVLLTIENSTGQDFSQLNTAYPANDYSFKVVVIPSASIKSGVDLNNYEAVSKIYGIQEYDM